MQKVLYRKYRPIDFKNIIGQKHVIKTLINEIRNNNVVHAYIFAGPKGSGKTSIAKIFSKAINCLNPHEFNPCNNCKNCVSINNNASIDFIELDAASNSGVAEIRQLIDSIEYIPNDLKYKIYIIDEAHMLTTNSWNALLKTIEEPPKNVIFIFATTEYNKIPPTIISRAERFDFNKISILELKQLIQRICEQEKITIDIDSIETIASLADGAARDALSLLEQMRSYANNEIKINDLNEMFGLLSMSDKLCFINLILKEDIQNIIININKYEKLGINFYYLMVEIIEILMDCYIFHYTKNKLLLKKITNTSELQNITFNEKIINLINLYNDDLMKIKMSDKPRFNFEFTILKSLSKYFGFKPETYGNINQVKEEGRNNNDMSSTKDMNIWRKACSTEPFDGPTIKLNKLDIKDNELDEEKPPVVTSDLFKTREYTIPEQVQKINKTVSLDKKWDQIEKQENNQTKPSSINQNNKLKETPINNLNIKNDFFAIAFNHDANIKDENNQKLNDLHENSDMEMSPIINCFLKAKKFLISSKNGCFILMDNQTLAKQFNEISESKEFINYYKENFGKLQKVIAIDKETAKTYLDEYKNLKQQTFKDVKIIVNDEDEKEKITQSLLDILNDSKE